MLFGDLLYVGRMELKGSVVHENINTPELSLDALCGAETEGPLCHVAGDQKTPPSLAFDSLPGHFSVCRLVQVKGGDVGAFPGEQDGDGPPDPGVGACYHRHLVAQFARA